MSASQQWGDGMHEEKESKKHDENEDGLFIHQGESGHPLMRNPEGNRSETPARGDGRRDSGDALYEFNKEGVPVARDTSKDAYPSSMGGEPDENGSTAGARKKRQGTEDAQKRSDTGTGL